jgi:hypothetical protein
MRLSSAIAAKAVGGYNGTDLKVLRDTIPFTSEAATGSTFEFFQNTKDSEVESNFIDNPLPEVGQHNVLAMGLVVNTGILTGENDFSLIKSYAALTDGEIEISTSQRETLLEADVQQHLVTEDHDWGAVTTANDGIVSTLEASSQDLLRLEEPRLIEPREVFEVDFQTARGGGIPAEADYTEKSITPGLTMFLQMAEE